MIVFLQDNDAVIATVKKGRSTTLRHCSRTQRIALDWLLERLREAESMTLRYVKTTNQNAVFLTKASFSAPQWAHLCRSNGLYPKFPAVSAQAKSINLAISIGGKVEQPVSLGVSFDVARGPGSLCRGSDFPSSALSSSDSSANISGEVSTRGTFRCPVNSTSISR